MLVGGSGQIEGNFLFQAVVLLFQMVAQCIQNCIVRVRTKNELSSFAENFFQWHISFLYFTRADWIYSYIAACFSQSPDIGKECFESDFESLTQKELSCPSLNKVLFA